MGTDWVGGKRAPRPDEEAEELGAWHLTRLWCSGAGSRASEGGEGVAGEAHGGPFGHGDGADRLVEVDGGGVPVEDRPFETRAGPRDRDGGDRGEESLANSSLTKRRSNK